MRFFIGRIPALKEKKKKSTGSSSGKKLIPDRKMEIQDEIKSNGWEA